MAAKLTGTGVALITPFTSNGRIDEKALKGIIKHIISNKCEYIVVLGTTGESVTLSSAEKKEVIRIAAETAAGRIPLVLGLGGNNTQELIEDMRRYDLKPFTAILSVSPYYNKPTQQGIYQHYKALAEASSLPMILYNVPGRTSSNITAETTLRLASDFKNIIGIKEASGNVEQVMSIISSKPRQFLVISGDDSITLPLIAAGADGVISVIANALPKSFSTMVRAALAGDFKKARKLHYELLALIPLLFEEGNPAGVKCALNVLGHCNEYLRLPLTTVSEKVNNRIVDYFKKTRLKS